MHYCNRGGRVAFGLNLGVLDHYRQMLRAPVKAGDGWKIYPLESIHYYGDIELNDIPKQV
jgi:hypothetical protein